MKYKNSDIFAGRYKLVKHLGTGGFAEVWKAKDMMAEDNTVAVKIFAPDKGLDADGITVFRREYALTFPLRHNHLLTAYHFDVNDGSPYLIMPFCAEGSLMSKIVHRHDFSEKEIAGILLQLADGLDYLHENGITHQDMKPDNVLILKPDYYVLADFGISSRIRRSVARSMRADQAKNYSAFTPAYAPPEKYISKPTAAGDIFSTGVTLYECLSGDVPFDDIGAALERSAKIPALPDKYSSELNDLLQQCMAVNPEERPGAKDLLSAAKAFLANGIWPVSEKPGPAEKEPPPLKKSRETIKVTELESIEKTEIAPKPKVQKTDPPEPVTKEKKKPVWLMPAVIFALLASAAFATYNFWPSANNNDLAEALKKEAFTKTFYQNKLESISLASTVGALDSLKNQFLQVSDTGQLFDMDHFDLAGFGLKWNERRNLLITKDSIEKAIASITPPENKDEEKEPVEDKPIVENVVQPNDSTHSPPSDLLDTAVDIYCACILDPKITSIIDKAVGIGKNYEKLNAYLRSDKVLRIIESLDSESGEDVIQPFHNFLEKNDLEDDLDEELLMKKISEKCPQMQQMEELSDFLDDYEIAEEKKWKAAVTSLNSQDFQAYIKNYPKGHWLESAKFMIGALGGKWQSSNSCFHHSEKSFWSNTAIIKEIKNTTVRDAQIECVKLDHCKGINYFVRSNTATLLTMKAIKGKTLSVTDKPGYEHYSRKCKIPESMQ